MLVMVISAIDGDFGDGGSMWKTGHVFFPPGDGNFNGEHCGFVWEKGGDSWWFCGETEVLNVLHHGFCFLPFQHFQTKPNKGPDHQVNLRKVHDKVHDSLRTCKSPRCMKDFESLYDNYLRYPYHNVQTCSNPFKPVETRCQRRCAATTWCPDNVTKRSPCHRWGAILRIQNAQIRMVANHMRLEVQSSYVGVVKLSCIWRQAEFLVRSA